MFIKGGKSMEKSNNDLIKQLARLQWLMHKHHFKNHKNHGPMADIHRGQGRVLALLKLKPEITQKELANILDIRSQSLGELLAKLERNGYITRTPSEEDRRAMIIRLTEEGKAATNEKEQEDNTKDLFRCLNESEQNNLKDYLGRIIVELEKELGDADDIEHEMHHHNHPHMGRRGFLEHCDRRRGFNHHCNEENHHNPFGRKTDIKEDEIEESNE